MQKTANNVFCNAYKAFNSLYNNKFYFFKSETGH